MSSMNRLYALCFSVYVIGVIQGAARYGMALRITVGIALGAALCFFHREILKWLNK